MASLDTFSGSSGPSVFFLLAFFCLKTSLSFSNRDEVLLYKAVKSFFDNGNYIECFLLVEVVVVRQCVVIGCDKTITQQTLLPRTHT